MRVPPTREEHKAEEESSFLDRIFAFLNKEIKPEVETFIEKGKDYLEELELEKKGKELAEKAKE